MADSHVPQAGRGVLSATLYAHYLGVQVAHWFVPRVDRTREHVAEQYAHFALGMVGAA